MEKTASTRRFAHGDHTDHSVDGRLFPPREERGGDPGYVTGLENSVSEFLIRRTRPGSSLELGSEKLGGFVPVEGRWGGFRGFVLRLVGAFGILNNQVQLKPIIQAIVPQPDLFLSLQVIG